MYVYSTIHCILNIYNCQYNYLFVSYLFTLHNVFCIPFYLFIYIETNIHIYSPKYGRNKDLIQ